MRLTACLAAAVAVAPALLFLPTVTPPAAAARPVPPRLTSLPVPIVDAAAAAPRGAGTAGQDGAGSARRTVASVDVGRSRPFDLVAVTWSAGSAPAGMSVQVRVREAGRWGAWEALGRDDSAPDPGSPDALAEARTGLEGTAPLLAARADGVQVRVDAAGPAPRGLRLRLVDGGTSPADIPPAAPAASAQAAAAAPRVITRAEWGADESLRDGSVSYNGRVSALVLHHTAGSNTYSTTGAYAELRATYAYHTQVRGWSDLGYNIVVDRFGRIFEGRKGSINNAVVGAHAGGFNTDTLGVSVMGNFETARPASAVVDAVARVVAWKAQQYGVDPTGTTLLRSSGGGTARYPEGTIVRVPTVMGHRDVGYTECPGANLYPQLPAVRAYAAARAERPAGAVQTAVGDWDGDGRDDWATWRDGNAYVGYRSGHVTAFTFGRAGMTLVAGDWDGDGRDSLGLFADGRWYLRNPMSSGAAEVTLTYGTSGDRPVVGRWPGARGPGLGVVRGNAWYLRRSLTSGVGEIALSFGRPGDVPVAADVDGDGWTEPAVVRSGTFHLADAVPVRRVTAVAFGRADDRPMLADFDGDRRAAPVVYRPGASTWFWRDDLRGGVATASLVNGG